MIGGAYDFFEGMLEGVSREGATHLDRNGKLWSGNFCGWIQNRQLIKGHVYTGEVV